MSERGPCRVRTGDLRSARAARYQLRQQPNVACGPDWNRTSDHLRVEQVLYR